MKKLLAIIAIAAFTACGGGNNESSNGGNESTNAGSGDSISRASDSVMQTGDTSSLNRSMGDSTSSSGSHGRARVQELVVEKPVNLRAKSLNLDFHNVLIWIDCH
jgi:hypothetical protein